MANPVMCSKCGERPAVVFISKPDPASPNGRQQQGLCIKCAMKENMGQIKPLLDRMGMTEEDLEEASDQMNEMLGDMDLSQGFQPGGAIPFPFSFGQQNAANNALGEQPAESAQKEQNTSKSRREKKKEKKERKFISLYCTDLTKKAKDGQLDNIIGRDDEIYRVTQILCRRTKNNPCLIGEPGVGKTAIAEGLALRIAHDEVPAKLAGKEIQLLDLTALVAGTQFRGQFESRIKGLIDEIKADGNVILFIDEVHNLVGAGDAEGSMNAANILKPALSRGEIQVIGATTFNEYRKYIEKDSALERRFQPVKVEEPSIESAYKVLLGIKKYYEDYHRVTISDSLVYKAVTLSERYVTDRFLPDKAIDLLDEACTCANLRNKAISEHELAQARLAELTAEEEALMQTEEDQEPDYEAIARLRQEKVLLESKISVLSEQAKDNGVTEDDLAKVINLWTGIPVRKIIDSDLDKLSDLEAHIKERIIGQDEAVRLVAAAIKRNKVQINPQRRPASFIFVGPTGVGKTELVKVLSQELFDTPETLIRLDMSEFMEKHSVSRLIGSPPGYVGYDEAGQLTEKVRRKPYSVILFDEIEKAHPDVMNILLQILDEGKTSDAQGRVVNFANTVIIMTSNAGSNRRTGALGFDKDEQENTDEQVMRGLKEFLRPEFIGRVDEVVVFHALSRENYIDIAKLLISDLEPGLKDKGIRLTVEPGVAEKIADRATGGERGARDIRVEIRRQIEDPIANLIIDNRGTPIDEIRVCLQDDAIKCGIVSA